MSDVTRGHAAGATALDEPVRRDGELAMVAIRAAASTTSLVLERLA